MNPLVWIGLVLIALGLGTRFLERRDFDGNFAIVAGLGALVWAAWPS